MGNLLLALALTVLALVLGACSATGPTARSRAAVEAALSTAETPVVKGKILYDFACARCHALYMPRSYTLSEWEYFVEKYGPRSRIDNAEEDLVLEYLRKNCLPE